MLISQSLFSDGAAAIIVEREGLWRFSQTGAAVIPNTKELLGLKPPLNPGDTTYSMTLSKYVASALSTYFKEGNGKNIIKKLYDVGKQLPALAIHPGGPRILETMQNVFCDLGWKNNAMESSFSTFLNYGNLGSTTMLFVLIDLISNATNQNKDDNEIIAMAFGPGVTIEFALFEKVVEN
jgi:predicted naringenin-chalcone synthase